MTAFRRSLTLGAAFVAALAVAACSDPKPANKSAAAGTAAPVSPQAGPGA